MSVCLMLCFFFSSRRRHTRYWRDWSSDVCSSDLNKSLDQIRNIPQISTNSRKVQTSEDNTVIIRTQEISEEEKKVILTQLKSVGTYQIDKEDKVGASVGEELKTSAIYALGIGAVLRSEERRVGKECRSR